MEETTSADIALLTEHFGYPPVSLLDDIINSINQLAERALASVEQQLLKIPAQQLGFKPTKPARSSRADNDGPPSDPTPQLDPEAAARHEIENGTHQLETLLCASIDRNFDKFELYVMQNILCIRPSEPREWIRLSHYEGLDLDAVSNQPTSGEEDDGRPSVEGVRRLRRQLQASQQLNVLLHAERARNEALLEALRGVVGGPELKSEGEEKVGGQTKMEMGSEHVDLSAKPKPTFGFLHDAGGLAAGAAESPLESTARFTLSQLQALRALSTSLRTLMPGLEAREEGDDDDGGRRSWRRERLEYVEGATRKHLERSRGLELGSDGGVRDGEWQEEGRRVKKDEVEGLEKIVGILGAGGEKGDEMDES